MSQPKYRFSPTLLDCFYGYVSSDDIWQEYWGNSDTPSKSPEDFKKEQFQGLIDRINRVPIAWEDSEKADIGTAFNEIIDAFILNRPINNKLVTWCKSDRTANIITIEYNKRTFIFPLNVCLEFSQYCQGAIPQYRVEGTLDTKYGEVLFTGYLDALMPCGKVIDYKTTGKYSQGKFDNNFQHLCYPFLLQQQGVNSTEFEYVVLKYYLAAGGKITN